MPIVALFWPPDPVGDAPVGFGSDMHVVREGPSPSLLEQLLVRVVVAQDIQVITAAKYVVDGHDDVTFRFQPSFVGMEASDPDGLHYNGPGLRVNMRNGVVTITEKLSPFTPLNFIMVISATNTPAGPPIENRYVRVQAHSALRRVWLTPHRLTVRRRLPPSLAPNPALDPRDTHMRFVVRAEFDDNVIGDLTLESGTTWGPSQSVNKAGLLLADLDDLPDAEIKITATLDARFGGPAATRSASATMVVKKGWHQLPPAQRPEIELVNRSGIPRKDTPETQVPNVVLMADGWGRASDREEFVGLTNEILRTLRESRLLRPFPQLMDSMCFWRWFVPPPPPPVPSPDPPGAFSVLSEVYLSEPEGKLFARLVPSATLPRATGDLTLENLLYMVGLPMPGENRSVSDLRKHWKATCRDFALADSRVDDDEIEKWLKLRTRTFVHCVDTEFHMGLGRIPSVEPLEELPVPVRFGPPTVFQGFESLERAMIALTTKATLFAGRPFGELWTDARAMPTGVEPPRFDNRRYVMCFVPLAGARGHGTGTGTPALISTRKHHEQFRVKPSADNTRGGHEVVGEALDDLGGIVNVLAHELTHSFGLGDEYADDRRRYEGKMPPAANLQSDSEVRDATKQINGSLVRWNWHRIQAAAVIEKEITRQDAFFAIDVRPGQTLQFDLEQQVLLRLRKFRENFIIAPSVLGPLVIKEIVGDHRLLVSPTEPTSLEALQTFKPGSIVFLPLMTPPANPDPKSPYMHLMTRQIRDWITDEKAPLFDAASHPANLSDTQDPRLPGFHPLRCRKDTWRVIGLYEGGERAASGIYHPAGGCLMRCSEDGGVELCAVCRYVLADVIDPFAHAIVDQMYRAIYTVE
jgi:hypothetical protein